VPGILNGLFAGRAGIASHGTAISVVGDNIANASTTGYKASRAEFADILVGGQATGKVVGSGSQTQAVTAIASQGTFEFTDRSLDLGIAGNGYFTVAKGSERFYTRAGNFKVDSAGFLVNQDGLAVLGFDTDGTLQPINVNSVAQDGIGSENVTVTGNLDASATGIDLAIIPTVTAAGDVPLAAPRTTYAELSEAADFSTVVQVFDSLSAPHNVTLYFFKDSTNSNSWNVRGYVNSEEVDPSGTAIGEPRLISGSVWNGTDNMIAGDTIALDFESNGTRSSLPTEGLYDMTATIPWNNGSSTADPINISLDPFTQYSSRSNILSISQDGRGVGAVTSLSVGKNGDISALFDNGRAAVIGTVGLVDFSNPEGLTRIGSNLLQQSTASGAPVIGRPDTGKMGSIQSGALELSTVDIATEFVKLITLQRGFQASSRMITTVNQLLNDVIQLV
jgi:flagellar hook protein FlgE